jgi:hypothetical protein
MGNVLCCVNSERNYDENRGDGEDFGELARDSDTSSNVKSFLKNPADSIDLVRTTIV